jgi:hypothetical protein
MSKKASGVIALMASGILLLGAPQVYADNETSGENGILSGNQVLNDVNAPVTVCGNAIGAAEAECEAEVETGDEGGDNETSGENGILSGNQVLNDVNAPVTVCGNAIGAAEAECEAEVETGDEGGDNEA